MMFFVPITALPCFLCFTKSLIEPSATNKSACPRFKSVLGIYLSLVIVTLYGSSLLHQINYLYTISYDLAYNYKNEEFFDCLIHLLID